MQGSSVDGLSLKMMMMVDGGVRKCSQVGMPSSDLGTHLQQPSRHRQPPRALSTIDGRDGGIARFGNIRLLSYDQTRNTIVSKDRAVLVWFVLT